jgi:D-alanyl-D-alanine carboxypeptidase
MAHNLLIIAVYPTTCRRPRKESLVLNLLVLTALLHVGPSAASVKPLDPSVIKRIDADVQAVLDHSGTPSAVIAVVAAGRVVYRQAYGQRDREQQIAATVDTHYEIGSITKQFTAAAILQLQERGNLKIDAKLATYLPDAPHAGEVTLRQLLSHTSGLPEYLDGPNIETEATRPATFAQLIARVAGKPLDFAPGSKMVYNNTGYILLGRVIEVVAQQSYRDYVRTHLLDRAGMTQTYTVADESRLADMAVGYRHVHGKLERAQPIHDTWGWSAGHLVSTLEDLEKWNRGLTQGKIISAASYAAMTTPVAITEGQSDYGLGFFVDSVRDQPRIGHTGGSFGFTTANEFFPKQNLRIIAFTNNGDNPEPGEIITNAVFDDLFPEIASAASKPAPGEDVEVTAKARVFFGQMQSGTTGSSLLSAKLEAKMKNGLAERLTGLFAPYGTPTQFVFKGARAGNSLHWYDYVIEFGPGSELKFAVGLDEENKIASISYG